MTEFATKIYIFSHSDKEKDKKIVFVCMAAQDRKPPDAVSDGFHHV
jgi:hypothetical protein